jgi:cytochrome c oxidase subunit 2
MGSLFIVAACGDDSPSALDPKGSEAEELAGVWWLMFGLAIGVYVLVGAFIVVGALRGRRRAGGRPSRISDGTFIWVGGLIVPALILAVLAVVTVDSTNDLRRRAPEGTLRIQVEGRQWWWAVTYPDHDVVTANEIRVPVGQPVAIELTSDDVIHSFWVPQLAGKLDTIPGQVNELVFVAKEAGVYRGQCAEYCGIQHAHMGLEVIAEPVVDFERWVSRHQRPPSEPASELVARGQAVFMSSACAGCHTVRGTEARGRLGPDLTDFGGRRTIGAATVPNTRGYLTGWILNAQSLKPGSLMPPVALSSSELQALVAYLESLA